MKDFVKPLRCVIMGPPGSGKGTLAKRIEGNFNMIHVSTANILQEHLANETELGKESNEYLKRGDVVPDNLLSKMILSILDGINRQNWLVEGFPRTVHQAKLFEEHHPPDYVLSLHVPFDELAERLRHRRVHKPSGRVYHGTWDPPKIPDKDDETGEPLEQEEANPDRVRRRLEAYMFWSRKVRDFYEDKKMLIRFSGATTKEIWPQIESFLKDKIPKEDTNPSSSASAV